MEKKKPVKIKDFFVGEELIDNTFYVKKQLLEDEDVDSMIYHSLIRTKSTQKKASLLFVHGLSEHSTRHVELAKKFALADYVVHIFDFRGFGYSSGERNRTPLKVLYEDLITIMTNVRKDLPLFIVAHSMGGGTIISLLLKNPHLKISGVVFTNPFLKMSQEEPVNFNLKKRITSMILPDDFEMFITSSPIYPHLLTKSPQAIGDCYADRLLAPVTTLTMIRTLMTIEKVLKSFTGHKFKYPTMFIVGGKDKLCPQKYFYRFLKKVKFTDMVIKDYPEGFHEIILDYEADDAIQLMIEWVDSKLRNAVSFGKIKRFPF